MYYNKATLKTQKGGLTVGVGERIRAARETKQMTLEELGAACGVNKQTIFKYERGIITNIPLDKLERIAEVLGTTPAWLMGWEESAAPIEPELDRLLESLRTRPEMRMLFDLADNATAEDVRKAVAIIEALMREDGR